MGLLAPLYALAALAIAGPILFHLIKRQPQGQQAFSSLMFLSPSPPQLTRRSRLDNIFLLLLRAAALGLIAFAFARPYFRQESFFNSNLGGRNIVVLLDTSASMQRQDVWDKAIQTLRELVDSISPEDRVGLYTVDASLHPIVPMDFEAIATPAASVNSVRSAIAELTPTWQRTELAQGLQTLADLFNAAAIAGRIEAGTENQIVLVSDLHVGSGLEALQGYPWPESVRLDVRQIRPQVAGNARASLMLPDDAAEAADDAAGALRIRIENNSDSVQQTFQLGWASGAGTNQAGSTTVQVPAGQVRVVPMVTGPVGATHIELFGDAWQADNQVFVPSTKAVRQQIAFVGPSALADDADLSYFLRKAPLDTPIVRREIVTVAPQAIDFSDDSLKAIVLEPLPGIDSVARELRAFADSGGTLVVCLARPLANPSADLDSTQALLRTLCDATAIEIDEAEVKDYGLLAKIDYTHPVFTPFADPRFNDFSKMRFWQHRTLSLPAGDQRFHVLASYDDLSPMLVEQMVGRGRVWILTTGWQPEASTLALSSKFVPILLGILDPRGKSRSTAASFEVGAPIDVSDLLDASALVESESAIVASRLDSSWSESIVVERDAAAADRAHIRLSEPGLYSLQANGLERQLAVQVPSSESQHLPLDREIFPQYGIPLGVVASDAERRDSERQLQVEELEGKQRLWQWLIALGIGVLAMETLLAGHLAHRQNAPSTNG